MGARAYNPAEARFLSVDPVIGGCANPYTYGYGDPLNDPDLTGQGSFYCKPIDAITAIDVGQAIRDGSGSLLAKILDKVSGPIGDAIIAAAQYFGEQYGQWLIDAGEEAAKWQDQARASGNTVARGEVVLIFRKLLGVPVIPYPPAPILANASSNNPRSFEGSLQSLCGKLA
jgi:hypothetical protein